MSGEIIENPTPTDWERPGTKIKASNGKGYHYVTAVEADYNLRQHLEAEQSGIQPNSKSASTMGCEFDVGIEAEILEQQDGLIKKVALKAVHMIDREAGR